MRRGRGGVSQTGSLAVELTKKIKAWLLLMDVRRQFHTIAERVASQGLNNTADWNNIDQQVGTLADQIVAKIC